MSKWRKVISLNILIIFFSLLFTHKLCGASAHKIDKSKSLETNYHINIENEHIGIVHNVDEVNSLIEEKLKESKQNYPDLKFQLDENFKIIKEKSFQEESHDKGILELIKDEIKIEASVSKIAIDNKEFFLPNETIAAEVLSDIKAKYSEDSADKIYFDKLPKIEDATVEATYVLTKDEAINKILNGKEVIVDYRIIEGDVIGTILEKFSMENNEFFELNPSLQENPIIKIGESVKVKEIQSLLNVIEEKEVAVTEEIPYEKKVIEDDLMYKGDYKTIQEGSPGSRKVTYAITTNNGIVVKKEETNVEILKEATEKIVKKGIKVIPSRGTGSFEWPTVGGYISSRTGPRWGKIHKGTDIARPERLDILAADNGTVVFAGWDGNYGNKIVVSHNNGYKTIYAHLESIDVTSGQVVEKGRKMGVMGTTGLSTGVHLHIELYKDGVLKDFLKYVSR